MPAAFFTTPAEIATCVAVYEKSSSIKAAAARLGCCASKLTQVLRSQGIDTSTRAGGKLEKQTLEMIKAECIKHEFMKDAANALSVHEITLRRKLKSFGITDYCSLLRNDRKPRARPIRDLIIKILREHGPMLDTQIAKEMATMGLNQTARNVFGLITQERKATGTQVFKIHNYARKEAGRNPGPESCVWCLGPGKDKPRPKQKPFIVRRRISQEKHRTKYQAIIRAKARDSALPFGDLLSYSRRNASSCESHLMIAAAHPTKAPSAFDHAY